MMTAVFTSLLVGVVLSSPLTWYAQPSFALILYGIPTWLGAMVVQSIVWFFASDEKGISFVQPHNIHNNLHYTHLNTTHHHTTLHNRLQLLLTACHTPLHKHHHTTHYYTLRHYTQLMTLILFPSPQQYTLHHKLHHYTLHHKLHHYTQLMTLILFPSSIKLNWRPIEASCHSMLCCWC